MKMLSVVFLCCATIGLARNSYTGGYSGAPGRQTCASSCHGGTNGSLVVNGFPSAYQPGQTYTITVKRTAGSPIVNFNATTRLGTTATVAGTFGNVMNAALYAGADGGVYASPHAIDSAVFQWTAPASGSGTVHFYLAGFQGTTSSANGQSTKLTITATEITTGVTDILQVERFRLEQNFPNPFNPSTVISYQLSSIGHVTLKVYDVLGRDIATLVNELQTPGVKKVGFDAAGLPGGVYFYRLTTGGFVGTKRMLLLK